MKIIKNPVFETKINRAVFINQDLVVVPQGKMPHNISEAVKFLFGEDAIIMQDSTNNHVGFKISNASYVLDNVKTLGAEWEYKEIKDEYLGEIK